MPELNKIVGKPITITMALKPGTPLGLLVEHDGMLRNYDLSKAQVYFRGVEQNAAGLIGYLARHSHDTLKVHIHIGMDNVVKVAVFTYDAKPE